MITVHIYIYIYIYLILCFSRNNKIPVSWSLLLFIHLCPITNLAAKTFCELQENLCTTEFILRNYFCSKSSSLTSISDIEFVCPFFFYSWCLSFQSAKLSR